MNIALIIAGGVGQRMGQSIPKQFMHVDDMPIIAYTMQAFEKHPAIDSIYVVCVDGWHEVLRAYARQYNITKLGEIVPGGANGQASIRNGVHAIARSYSEDDVVLIHDAIRPMVSQDIISGCLSTCEMHGSAITIIPCAEAMLTTEDQHKSTGLFDRDKLKRTQTPQAFTVKKLLWAHEQALARGITNSVATCTLMLELGEQVYFNEGSEKNIKLTTIEDVEIFRALLLMRKHALA